MCHLELSTSARSDSLSFASRSMVQLLVEIDTWYVQDR